MLEGEEPEVRETGDLAVSRADSEDTTHGLDRSVPGLAELLQPHSEQGIPSGRAHGAQRDVQLGRQLAQLVLVLRRAGEHRTAADLAEELEHVVAEVDVRSAAREERCLSEAHAEPALGGVVRQRAERRRLPEEGDEPCLGLEIERGRRATDLAEERLQLGARERERRRADDEERVAFAPRLRDAPDVRYEPDRPDDGRGMDRAPVRLVVERDVAGHDRHAERAARRAHALDRLRQLPGDLGLLRVAEVEAVREADRLAARARDVPGRLEDGKRAAEPRVEAGDPTLAVEAERETAHRRAEPNDGRVQTGTANRAGADELVVAAIDERAASDVRGGEEPEQR